MTGMQPRPLPPILRSRAFSTSAARQAGVAPHRLRRTDLDAPFRGVRHPAAPGPIELEERCRAYRQVMKAGSFFSHVTAAELLGLPLPRPHRESGVLHVSALPPARAPRGRGICGHRLDIPPEAIVRLRGLPVPEPAEVWCELGALLPVDDLVIAGDALLRRKGPLTALERLADMVDRAAGRPGIRSLREALPLVRPRTDSPMESVLRLAIVRSGLPEPSVNYAVLTREGVLHGDLAFPAARVIVEYDGDHHRTDDAQYHHDVDRLWRLQDAGWHVVRINRTHMSAGAAEALRRIRSALVSS